MLKWSYLFICCFFGLTLLAQNGTISGKIVLESKEPATNVLVFIKALNKSTFTDNNGIFTLNNIPFGKHQLETNSAEAENSVQNIELTRATLQVNLTLKNRDSEELIVVILAAKSEKQKIENKGFAVNVIETKVAALRNLQTNELLDRTAGVRIRQNGGLGSEVQYNINGLSGNAVRIFIDGIPISTYGSSFDLNSIPPSMIERI